MFLLSSRSIARCGGHQLCTSKISSSSSDRINGTPCDRVYLFATVVWWPATAQLLHNERQLGNQRPCDQHTPGVAGTQLHRLVFQPRKLRQSVSRGFVYLQVTNVSL